MGLSKRTWAIVLFSAAGVIWVCLGLLVLVDLTDESVTRCTEAEQRYATEVGSKLSLVAGTVGFIRTDVKYSPDELFLDQETLDKRIRRIKDTAGAFPTIRAPSRFYEKHREFDMAMHRANLFAKEFRKVMDDFYREYEVDADAWTEVGRLLARADYALLEATGDVRKLCPEG